MRRYLFAISFVILTCWSCDLFNSVTGSKTADGLKEALRVGTDTSVSRTSKKDGFFANAAIKIFLPEEAQTAISVVELVAPDLADTLVLKINRAAEKAASSATPIMVDAITGMTFEDAVQILNGPDDAATVYLKTKTEVQLQAAFQPIIEDALTDVGAQQLWQQFADIYNNFPTTVNPIPDNLAEHTTKKGLDGLFHVIAEEEAKIRNDVDHQVTALLQEIFGG